MQFLFSFLLRVAAYGERSIQLVVVLFAIVNIVFDVCLNAAAKVADGKKSRIRWLFFALFSNCCCCYCCCC